MYVASSMYPSEDACFLVTSPLPTVADGWFSVSYFCRPNSIFVRNYIDVAFKEALFWTFTIGPTYYKHLKEGAVVTEKGSLKIRQKINTLR